MAWREYTQLGCLLLLPVACMGNGAAEDTAVIELLGKQTDAVRICWGGNHIRNLNIQDLRLYKAAHHDAIQLIPPKTTDRQRRLRVGDQEQDWVVGDQMTGTVLENVTVENCSIRSPSSPLQGIFAGDGLFNNLRLLGNHVQTASDHSITINGLLSGEISDNVLQAVNDKPPVIRLYPARIGGNLAEEGLVYILDFADEKTRGPKLQYLPITLRDNYLSGLPDGQAAEIIDSRSRIPDTHRLLSFGLKRFRYHAFMEKFSNLSFGEYRQQNAGKDFARLKIWLEDRIAEYGSGKRIMPDALPAIPPGDERRTHILPLLRKALANAINSHALDHVSLSNFPETPIRAFTAKQLALRYGELQPLDGLDARDQARRQQMERLRKATLKYLLPAGQH